MTEKPYVSYPISDTQLKKLQDKQDQTPPSPLPFTIKAHAIFGYHIKFWIIGLLLVIAMELTIFLLMKDQLGQYLWVILAQVAALIIGLTVVIKVDYKKSLTITDHSIEIAHGEKVTIIPYESLDPVIRGWAIYGRRNGVALAISSKVMGVRYVASAINWSKEDLRKFYATVPKQYRKDDSDPRIYLHI